MNNDRIPAIFMDRDGVLTVEKKQITMPWDIELYECATYAVQKFHDMGYIVIVVSNQSGIARGLYSEKELETLHKWIKKETGVDEIYYCPHHPDGIINEYRKECNCRKPKLGMFFDALNDFPIDVGNSYMVGDRRADMEFGRNAGLTTVLVRTGYGGEDMDDLLAADYVVDNIKKVCDILI